jgi:hypothetical protein
MLAMLLATQLAMPTTQLTTPTTTQLSALILIAFISAFVHICTLLFICVVSLQGI